MMQLIDHRGKPIDKSFASLNFGECYQDTKDRLCMKIGHDRAMVWVNDHWVPGLCVDTDDPVISLKTTITVEREG